MPRKPRLFLPEQPQHVVVRGHNRDPILARHEDFRFLYRCVRDAAKDNGLAVHAWVFMHNHLHLLATPETAESLPRAMQSIGRRYAQYFNRTYRRSGSLWEGRYKASLVDSERYLLTCYRYIEMNPVRAGIVKRPEDYVYSSYHANGLGKEDPLVTPHPVYLGLVQGSLQGSESSRTTPTPGEAEPLLLDRASYRVLFEEELSRKELTTIRRGTERCEAVGNPEFVLRVAKLMGN